MQILSKQQAVDAKSRSDAGRLDFRRHLIARKRDTRKPVFPRLAQGCRKRGAVGIA